MFRLFCCSPAPALGFSYLVGIITLYSDILVHMNVSVCVLDALLCADYVIDRLATLQTLCIHNGTTTA